MKAKTKFTRLWSILLVLVMVVGMIPIAALAEEPDAAQQFADAPGEFFYRNDGGYDSEGPTEDTTFTLTEPTMITGIWTYHWYAANYDIDFSQQTIQLKDTATNTVVYSGAVRVGHIWNVKNCDWIVLPNIVLQVGTYQVIDSHNESWCALNSKGVCMVKGYSTTPSTPADFSANPTAALNLLNAAKTGTEDSTWDPDTNTLTLNGVNFTTTASTAVKLPEAAIIVLNGDNIITSGEAMSQDSFGIYALGDLTIKGAGKLTVTSGTANDDSQGIYAKESIDISGNADVIATSGTANDSCYGIHAGDSIDISGNAKVTAIGGEAGEYSHGIHAVNNLTIEGGNVTAAGGTAMNANSYGIYSYYDINISGGTVIATGGAADSYSLGIYASKNVFVSGTADVTAEGGSAAENDSNGICAGYYVTITGGSVKATGGTANSLSVGISADNDAVTISGDNTVVTATGGTATKDSYGIYAYDNVTITGGTVIAKANTEVMNKAPSALPTAYQWRTSESGAYNKYPDSAYTWNAAHTYLEIKKLEYTVTFDANGGTGTMTAQTGVLGDYTLPANGFTAPAGKQFKAWSVNGNEKAVGDKITVTANTTVKAVWENITYTVTFDANGGTGTMTDVTGISGEYTLPANGFTAPEGKQFKAWSVDGIEKAVGDKITVSANTTVKAVWENIPAAPIEYKILDGANSKWTQDSDGSLSIRGSGAFSEFVGVKVDGVLVDAKNYTVKEGSTIVTLKSDYLNSLTVGSHTLEIIWTDGSASTTFSVNAKSPQTGDNNSIALWIALLFVSGIGVMGTTIYIRKKKYSVK